MKKLLLFFSFIVVFLVGAISLRLWQQAGASQPVATYTGQDLFDAVNQYRSSRNVTTLQLDPMICDNLVERYLAVKNPDSGHAGFKEWVATEQIKERGRFDLVGELYIVDTINTKEAIDFWSGSPGHRLTLEMAEMTHGCSYAHQGVGVVVLGARVPEGGR